MALNEEALLRRVVIIVALLNLAYFGVELSVGLTVGGVSLIADSVDFLEDASVNLLIALTLAWSATTRARVGMLLALILLAPAGAFLWAMVQKVASGAPADPGSLSLTGLGALGVNLTCAFLLAPFRKSSGSLSRAAFLSARNDALANIAIICTGPVTAWTGSIWPDIVVGMVVAALNVDAAREVWEAAHDEHRSAAP